MTVWLLYFGPSPAGLAWIVAREDGTGPTLTFEPEAYEEARHQLIRHALDDDVDAVQLVVEVVEGVPSMRRLVLDR